MLNTINVDLIISFVMRAELEWHKWTETTMLFIISLKHFGGFQPDSSIQKTRSDLTWLYKSRQNLSRLHSKKRFQPTGISPLCSHYTDTDLKGRKSPLAFRAGALPSQAYWYTWLSELVMCVCVWSRDYSNCEDLYLFIQSHYGIFEKSNILAHIFRISSQ